MTDLHAGYSVPASHLEEIPMGSNNQNGPNTRRPQYVPGIPNVESYRSLGAESYWDFLVRYKIAMLAGTMSAAVVIIFITLAIFFALKTEESFSNRYLVEEITRKSKLDEFEEEMGQRRQGFEIQEKLSDGMLDTMYKEVYNALSDDESHRYKRDTKEEKMNICKKNEENCKVVLNSMHQIVRNVNDQVEELQKLLDRIGIINGTRPVNTTMLSLARCLECQIMESNDTITFEKGDSTDNSSSVINTFQSSNESQITGNLTVNDNFLKNTTVQNIEKHQIMPASRFNATYTEMMKNIIPESIESEETEPKDEQNMITDSTEESHPVINRTISLPEVLNTSHTNYSTVNHPDGTKTTFILKNTTIIEKHPVTSNSTMMSKNKTDTTEFETASEGYGFMDIANHLSNLKKNGTKWFKSASRKLFNESHVVFGDVDRPRSTEVEEYNENEKNDEARSSNSSNNDKLNASTTDANPPVLTTLDPGEQQSEAMVSGPIRLEPRITVGEPSSFVVPTAETSKSSQQLLYTPSMTWMPYPVCFYRPPNSPPQSFRQTAPGGITFPVTSNGAPYPGAPQTAIMQPMIAPSGNAQLFGPNYNQFQPMMQPVQPVQQTVQYVPLPQYQPTSVPVLPQQVGPTGPGLQPFQMNQGNQFPSLGGARSPYYCSYIPAPTFQFPVIPGVSEYQRTAPETSEFHTDDEKRFAHQGRDKPESRDYSARCPMNTYSCADNSLCLTKSQWCDGHVDCPDASDETRCSCRDRVDKERLCDGYFDCPRGEDELGCFGCDRHSFSCDDWGGHQHGQNCVPLHQRCDGYSHCPNGKDETDCYILTHSVQHHDMFSVGYTMGYLHRNWQGRWYPTCTLSEAGAMEACRAEIGPDMSGMPSIRPVDLREDYQGSYLMELPSGEVQTIPSCYNKAMFVECPPMPCGTRVLPRQEFYPQYDNALEDTLVGNPGIPVNYKPPSKRSVDYASNLLQIPQLQNVSDSGNNKGNDSIVGSQSRVVGGRPSQPKAWPSLVAIYKDGTFHCGGAILDEYWILTAAHCVDNYPKHYYEIQSGLLRRFSFSPMEQSRRAKLIIVHHDYEYLVMKNDLALIRLDKPLYFNRWVRPICLPEMMTAGPNWRRGPPAETTCTTVGWGATAEHGPDPDHMREVEVPILPHCKHRADQNEAEICAGMPQGGRDACQGDSGGPLMCRNPMSPSQWYLAGIVSHGEGCARPNEPGAYTKVSKFVDWIDRIRRDGHNIPAVRGPLEECPGLYCDGGFGRCISARRRCDQKVDCLDAEDELNCHEYNNYDFLGKPNPSIERDANEESSTRPNAESTTEGDETIVMESTTDSVASSSDSLPSTSQTPVAASTSNDSSDKIASPTVTTNNTATEEPEQNDEPEKTSEKNLPIVPKVLVLQPPTPKSFICKKLIQNIPFSKRCDRTVDCEDGTDENDCSCRDYLINAYPAAICDGHIDCHDKTDEENCVTCGVDEFHCRRSGKCIPLKNRCDRHIDCPLKEDELDCFSLTNGEYIITDIDGRPHLNMQGVLTGYRNGKWIPVCRKHIGESAAILGKDMCEYLGFGGCDSYNETLVQDKPLEIRASSQRNVFQYEYPPSYVLPTSSEPTCDALYLQCRPEVTTDVDNHQVQVTDHGNNTFLWPWQAAIFVDGKYHCSAVLLEPSWLLTSMHCADDVHLELNSTAALLGMSKSYLRVDGPHQEIIPIDEIKPVENSDALLLHLKHPVNITRHIQPIYLQKRTYPATEEDACVAVGVDEEYHSRTIFLQAMVHNCPDCHRCYKNIFPEDCMNKTSLAWSGTVVCLGSGGWYPAAIYHEKDGACGFLTTQSLTSIDYVSSHLITAMAEKPKLLEGPICDGFRCPLGQCVSRSQVCDGVPDCRDGADEDPKHCQKIQDHCSNSIDDIFGCKCKISELRCGNGQCVPKTAFCDGHVDCSDGTDEPAKCSCAEYLRLTSPERICDGRRHCLDKSDESPELCLCKDASFKCEKEGECVSQDFVCDGQPDCTMGEDEKNCQMLKRLPEDSPGTGEVIQRSYGVWHSQCFPIPVVSQKEVEDLCIKLGFSNGRTTTERSSLSPIGRPMVPILDKFYMVRLNPQSWVVMRDNKPLVTLQPPQETCHRLFVTCK